MAFQPNRITKAHVIAAVNNIERNRIKLRASTGYDVIIKNKRYPPKEIVRYSHRLATKEDPGTIYGGEQTNSILRNLGFEVVEKINLWKLGCNWGKNAPSFYEFIHDHNIVIGLKPKFVYSYNDLILITEGFTVYAIAQVKEIPRPVTEEEDLKGPLSDYQIDYNDNVTFAMAEWYELRQTEVFSYQLQQGIRRVRSKEVRDMAIDIWESKGELRGRQTIHLRTPDHFPDKNWLYPALVLVNTKLDDDIQTAGFELLVYKSLQSKSSIGHIKVLAESRKYPELSSTFIQLPENYCSLGQTIDFYHRLKAEFALQYLEILRQLNDCAYNDNIRDRFEKVEGFKSSLLRTSEAELALNEARAIVDNKEIVDRYMFKFSCKIGAALQEHSLEFEFNQEFRLPNRFFCLIGKNGTGKTQFISAIANKLTDEKLPGSFGGERPSFSRVITASFSYFDKFKFPDREDISYHFIGVKDRNGLYSEEAIANLVWQAFRKISDDKRRKELWLESIRSSLEVEYLDFDLNELVNLTTKAEFLARTEDIFSSGQKIIFQFITRFLSVIDYKSLLIFDEPETHLHPNIAGRLLRSIHDILKRWRSFCILSTHSPIIVQEIPSRYIRIFDRHQNTPIIRNPLIECFGENLTNISNSIFETDQEKEIYKTELERLSIEYSSSEINALFDRKLSMNARLYLQLLIPPITDVEM